MANNSNLKIKMGVDASGVQKGLNDARRDIKSFEASGKNALSALSDALGVNIGKIGELQRSFSGAAASMAQKAGEANEGIIAISKSFGLIGAAAATMAIGVAREFGKMKEAAQAYLETTDGISLKESSKAYIDTQAQFVRELQGGKAAAEAAAEWSKSMATFRSSIEVARRTGLTSHSMGVDATEYLEQMRQMKEMAEAAESYQKKITQARLNLLNMQVQLAATQNEIAEYEREAADREKTKEERLEAATKWQEAISRYYAMQRADQKAIADNMKAIDDLLPSTPAEIAAANNEMVKFLSLTSAEEQALKSVDRMMRQIKSSGTASPVSAAGLTSATAEAFSQSALGSLIDATLNEVDAALSAADAAMWRELEKQINAESRTLEGKLKPISIKVEPKLENYIMADDIRAGLEDMTSSISEAFGSLFSDVLSGSEGAFANFGSGVLAALGAFAQKFGAIIMSIGFANTQLQSVFVNPYGAIAAGAALIALGAAVKSAASYISSGSYATGGYSSTAAQSSSYSSVGGEDYTTRALQVEVTGQLVASGSQLVAVISNEGKRKNRTT